MGSIPNALFSILLGWLRTLWYMIWSSAASPDGNAFLSFVGKQWKTIAVILCLIGMGADLLVRLLKRKTAKSGEHTPAAADPEAENNVHVNTEEGRFSRPAAEDNQYDSETVEDELDRWRTEEEKRELYDRAIRKADEAVASDDEKDWVQNTYSGKHRSRRRNSRMNAFFGENRSEDDYHYQPPKPVFDQKEAYYRPVFPQNWKKDGEGS